MTAKVYQMPGKKPSGGVEVTMFVADQPDLMNQVYTLEALQKEILPKVLKNPRVEDAWMDGKRLVARLKPRPTAS